MKQFRTANYSLLLFFVSGALITLNSCYKDKGNYTYHTVVAPVVTNLDTLYNVFVGDSLVVKPTVILPGDTTKLVLSWTILKTDGDLTYNGNALRLLFGLGAGGYTTRLTITNPANGMEYFYYFTINSQTNFAMGTTVLTLENGVSQLSFIKPNDSVQARIYQAVNPKENLPSQPTQILAMPQAYQPPIISYWVFGKGGTNTGVKIDANTFKKMKYLTDNYFAAPDTTLTPYHMFANPLGVISGVINGTLYYGTTSTWDQAPTYGMFDMGATGDYTLSPEIVMNYTGTFGPGNYIGFDTKKSQFIRFNIYGGIMYFGPAYSVLGTAFNPLNLGMKLEHLQQINGGVCYAFCRSANDSLYELKFDAEFNGPFEFTAMQKRPFSQPGLITADTKWQATPNEIMYFTSGNKIYRYNPTNQDFKILNVDFGSKAITMIKVSDDGNTLYAGVDGSLYYLDISTGKFGDIKKRIDGLPGTVIDLAVRLQ